MEKHSSGPTPFSWRPQDQRGRHLVMYPVQSKASTRPHCQCLGWGGVGGSWFSGCSPRPALASLSCCPAPPPKVTGCGNGRGSPEQSLTRQRASNNRNLLSSSSGSHGCGQGWSPLWLSGECVCRRSAAGDPRNPWCPLAWRRAGPAPCVPNLPPLRASVSPSLGGRPPVTGCRAHPKSRMTSSLDP